MVTIYLDGDPIGFISDVDDAFSVHVDGHRIGWISEFEYIRRPETQRGLVQLEDIHREWERLIDRGEFISALERWAIAHRYHEYDA